MDKLKIETFKTFIFSNKLTSCEKVLEQIANQCITDNIIQSEKKRIGLYLATLDAGAIPSITFWKDALETGVSFVGPALFPWTLSNTPATYLAQKLQITGPNYTLTGKKDAFFGILDQAVIDFEINRIEKALIFALDFEKNMAFNPRCSYIVLNKHTGIATLEKISILESKNDNERASDYLANVITESFVRDH